MSGVFAVFRILSLGVGIGVSVLSVLAEAVLLPFRIFTELVLIVLGLLPFVTTIIQNRRLAVLILLLVAVVLLLGFFALTQTGFVLSAIDALYECILAPIYEIVYKFVINTAIGLFQILAAAYNTILQYIVVRGRLWFIETSDVIQCILNTTNVLELLKLPGILWKFIYSLFFILTTEARLSRREIFTARTLGLTGLQISLGSMVRPFYEPNEMPVIVGPQFNPFNQIPDGFSETFYPNAKEFPGGFGAFGDPVFTNPQNPASVFRHLVKNIYAELAVIVGKSGNLVFQIASDLQRPAGKFALNLIVTSSAQGSYFGQFADILARIVQFISLSWSQPLSNPPFPSGTFNGRPPGATGYSDLHFKINSIIAKGFRIAADVIRYITLLLNDILTVQRPAPFDPVCDNVDFTDPFEIAQLFQGFPVIDLFLNPFTPGGGTYNLNIFRSNWEFCRQKAIQYHFPVHMNSLGEFSPGVESLQLRLELVRAGTTILNPIGAILEGLGVFEAIGIQTPQANFEAYIEDLIENAYNNIILLWQRSATQCGILTRDTFPIQSTLQGNYDVRFVQYADFINRDDYEQGGGSSAGWQEACQRWDGLRFIRTDDRIDYLGEAFDIINNIATLVIDPFDERFGTTEAAEELRDEVEQSENAIQLAECIVDRLVNGLIFTIDSTAARTAELALGLPTTCANFPFTFLFHLGLESCVIFALEDVAFEPAMGPAFTQQGEVSKCRDFVHPEGVPDNPMEDANYFSQGRVNTEIDQQNIFYCLIAKLSVEDNGFFGSLCDVTQSDLLTGVVTLPTIICDDGREEERKRSVPDLEEKRQRTIRAMDPTRKFMIRAQLFMMQLSSEMRASSDAFDECVGFGDSVLSACNSTCSLTPCVDETFDCFADRLENGTLLHRVATDNRAVAERLVTLVAMGADFLYSCEDSDIASYLSWSTGMFTAFRDFFVRFSTFAFDYGTAYSDCMQKAVEQTEAGASRSEVERAYAECIGAPVPNPDPPNAPANKTRDYYRESLFEAGITPESGTCGAIMHTTGFALDRNPSGSTTSGYAYDMIYRGCSFMHAFGARANHRGWATLPIKDFVHPWRAGLAVSSSTAELNVVETEAFKQLPAKPALPKILSERPLLVGGGNDNDNNSDSQTGRTPKSDASVLVESVRKSFMSYATVIAVGTYLADMHDLLLHSKMPRPAHVLDKEARNMRINAVQGLMRARRNKTATMEQFEANVRAERSSKGTTGRKKHHTSADSFAKVFNAVQQTISWHARTESGVEYDAAVNFRDADGTALHYDVLLRHGKESNYSHMAHQQMTPVSASNLAAIIRGTARVAGGEVSLHQAARVALDELEHLHGVRMFRDSAHVNRALSAARVVLSTAMRIVNRRLRVEALPPVQAAVMSLEVMTQSSDRELELWSRGELGYIVGEGFVPIEDYNLYMEEQQEERERWMRLYSAHMSEDELNNAALISHKWANQRRLNTEFRQRHALPTPHGYLWDMWYDPNVRRHGFARRARFLVKHNLAHADQHLHHHVPDNWQYRAAALRANTSDERMRVLSLAAAGSDQAMLQAMTRSAQLAGLSVDFEELLEPLIDGLTEFGTELWMRISEFFEGFGDIEVRFNEFIMAITCPGPGAYRLAGSDPYKLGCIPYISERTFNFWESFPRSPTLNKGFYGFIEGPGYIEWPSEMIVADCGYQRNGVAQCVDPPPFLFDAYFSNEEGASPELNTDLLELSACLSDYCPLLTAQEAQGFPLCPVCDYCVRTYQSAFDFGFTNGFDVILVWIGLLRAYIRLIFSTDIAFTFVLLFFPLFALSDILSPFGPAFNIVLTVLVPLFDTLFSQNPQRLLFTLWPLYILHEALPLISWGVWVFALFPTVASAWLSMPYDTAPVLEIVDLILPDSLALTVLTFIRNNAFLGTLIDFSFVDPVITLLTNNVNMSPTLAQTIYSVFAVILVPITAAILVVAGIAILYSLRLLVPILRFLATLLREAFAIFTRVRTFLFRRRIRVLRANVSDLEDQQEVDAARNRRRISDLEEEEQKDAKTDAEQNERLQQLEDRVKEE